MFARLASTPQQIRPPQDRPSAPPPPVVDGLFGRIWPEREVQGRPGVLAAALGAGLIGALLVGAVLAPLSTYYSLVLDRLVAPEHRAEVFALLRTANALGIITSSALISLVSLGATFTAVIAVMSVVLVVTGAVFTSAWVAVRRRRLAREAAEARAHGAAAERAASAVDTAR